MEKEFIPYEQALALKELGFDEPCFYQYVRDFDNDGELIHIVSETNKPILRDNTQVSICSGGDCFAAPLYQQAFRWFIDEHKLFGQVNVCTYFIYDISNNDGFHPTLKMIKEYDRLCNNYEESELECLKKLIEIVKNK